MTERLASRLRSIVARDDTAGSRSLSQSDMGSCRLPAARARRRGGGEDRGGAAGALRRAHCSRLGAHSKRRARQSTRNRLSFN
eukprot:2500397-Prymnesium_polylepis.1